MTADPYTPDEAELIGCYAGAMEEQAGENYDQAKADAERGIAKIKADATSELTDLLAYAHRFWPRVEVGRKQECWSWTGPTLEFGHGRADTPAGKAAHRYAWATANGRKPLADEVIRHKCDNPPCVNPDHLEVGTQMDNVNDAIDRGRAPFERGHCKKGHELTPENSLFRQNGERRCKKCTREYEREWWNKRPRRKCWLCDSVALEFNLKRHLKNQHDIEASIGEIRDRADRIEEEA